MSKLFVPRSYQSFAIAEIIRKPAVALMLDMGLGKTVITLTAMQALKYDYLDATRILIVAPLRVAQSTWSDECMEWEHLQDFHISKVLGSERQRKEALQIQADAYIINRENIPWLVGFMGSKWDFDMLVIDESSSFKNPSSKRFKALRKVRPKIRRVVELTGTPAPNGLMDLWSQIYLLDMGIRLGKSVTAYRNSYFTAGWGNGMAVYEWKARQGAEKEIYKRISDICVSMKSADYLQLPDLIMNKIAVNLPDTVKARYKQLEKDLVMEIGGAELVASSAAALSNKLLQLANGSVYDGEKNVVELHSEKIFALKEIADLNEERSVLVFYWFKHDLAKLKEHFPKARELKKPQDIKDWNAGRIQMMLAHPASAGHGLNLQHGGNIIVWYGLTWSLELYQQANKRLHRSGQTKPVIAHHLVATGTIDEDVIKALQDKDAGQKRMLEAVKARISAYKNEMGG